MDILADHVTTGNQNQGDDGGKEHTKAQAHRHGDQELSLEATFQYHGGESSKGG